MAAAAGALVQAGARPLLPSLQGTFHDRERGTSCRRGVNFGRRQGCTIGASSVFSSSISTLCNSTTRISAAAAPLVKTTTVLRAVAEKDVDTVEPRETPAFAQKTQYHFLIANAKFMLDDEEHFQELMRERLRHFGELKREQDFWLVIEPAFLSKFPDIERRLGRPAVALVSTDATWITFMKLRLDRVLKGSYEADSLTEALGGGNSATELSFQEPEQWTAPYPKYEGRWWIPFLPPQ